MKSKQSQSDLEVKLESLKDQFIEALKSTRLVVNPKITGLTLAYEKRRGLNTQEGCKVIGTGLAIMLKRAYKGYVNLRFETINEESKIYRATLEILAETEEKEKELSYEALTKLNEFINCYNKSPLKRK